MDTTKSYVILDESINKFLSVSKFIVLMRYVFYEINFNDPIVKFVYICCEIVYVKNRKKKI